MFNIKQKEFLIELVYKQHATIAEIAANVNLSDKNLTAIQSRLDFYLSCIKELTVLETEV